MHQQIKKNAFFQDKKKKKLKVKARSNFNLKLNPSQYFFAPFEDMIYFKVVLFGPRPLLSY